MKGAGWQAGWSRLHGQGLQAAGQQAIEEVREVRQVCQRGRWKNGPQDVHVLIPGPHGCVSLHGKGEWR